MNYASLVSQIQDFCESSETNFVAEIPNFVQLAENQIYNAVQLPALRKNQTGTVTASNPYLTLPTDWLATYSLAVQTGSPASYSFLLDKDVNYIREAFPAPTSTGVPTHYAIFDSNTVILGPTPDQSYTVELHYFYYPTSIVTAGSTWLGDNFPSALLYGSLRHAYLFQKGEQDIATAYDKQFGDSMALLKGLADGKDRRDAYRSGQNRVQVP